MPASGERPVPDRERPPRRRFSFGLRFSLVVYSLLTVLLTAAAVDVPWQYISRQNVSDLAGQINAEILNGLSNEVDGVFRTTVAAQQTIRDSLEAGIVDVEDAHKREPFFFAFLQANPQFSWVSFGKPNGDLYGIDFTTLYRVNRTNGAVTTIGSSLGRPSAIVMGRLLRIGGRVTF